MIARAEICNAASARHTDGRRRSIRGRRYSKVKNEMAFCFYPPPRHLKIRRRRRVIGVLTILPLKPFIYILRYIGATARYHNLFTTRRGHTSYRLIFFEVRTRR